MILPPISDRVVFGLIMLVKVNLAIKNLYPTIIPFILCCMFNYMPNPDLVLVSYEGPRNRRYTCVCVATRKGVGNKTVLCLLVPVIITSSLQGMRELEKAAGK